MGDLQADYRQLCDHTRETALLQSIDGLLHWDHQTYMPPASTAHRARQSALLAGLIHRRQTDPRVGDWLSALASGPLADDPQSDTGATIHWLRRDFEKKTRLPQPLVEALAETASLGQQAWVEARKKNDFEMFRPLLEKTVHLKQQEADALGYDDCRYDALLDQYEPDARSATVRTVLADLRTELVPLVEAIAGSRRQPRVDVLHRRFPVESQAAFGTRAARAFGFDFDRGRLDVTHHPFCGGAGPDDVRITTRYEEHFFGSGFFSILHEAGHGLYEQGLPGAEFGLPLGEAISLGIHESQSRMWENLVGRSRPFWDGFYRSAQATFSEALADVPLDDFFLAINDVRPSLIRVEADEVTYNLHILIRFDLEHALIDENLAVRDLPDAWNARYREDLGIEPPSDADGVLQDIHWSAGLFGYFPTYALGNLYASQFFETARDAIGDLDGAVRQGDFSPLLAWLREHIHAQGRRFTATQLVERITGQSLSSAPLMRHLRGKFEPLFGL